MHVTLWCLFQDTIQSDLAAPQGPKSTCEGVFLSTCLGVFCRLFGIHGIKNRRFFCLQAQRSRDMVYFTATQIDFRLVFSEPDSAFSDSGRRCLDPGLAETESSSIWAAGGTLPCLSLDGLLAPRTPQESSQDPQEPSKTPRMTPRRVSKNHIFSI